MYTSLSKPMSYHHQMEEEELLLSGTTGSGVIHVRFRSLPMIQGIQETRTSPPHLLGASFGGD